MAASCLLSQWLAGTCRILLFEKEKRVGKKLLATGNGRCNLTNMGAVPADYGASAEFVAAALASFPPKAAVDFFQELGLLTKEEGQGKVYPLCNQAAAVLDLLRLQRARRGVETITETRVCALRPEGNKWRLTTPQQEFWADRVLVTTGGVAAPQLGGGKESYGLLTSLGHRLTPLVPALVQLKTETTLPRALKGIKIDAAIRLLAGEKELGKQTGELLFTEYGVSGPPVFQLSRLATADERQDLALEIDFMPEYSPEYVAALLQQRRERLGDFLLEDFLTGFLQKRLGQVLLKACGIAPLSRSAATLEQRELTKLCQGLKGFRLPVTGTLGWKQAQVTAGGLQLAQWDCQTLRSKLAPGLYAAGEILDVDGPCGGYNLQWAWSSAYLAAWNIAKEWKTLL